MSKAAELAALIGSQTALSNRNLIINGAMRIDQRNGGSSVSTSGGGAFVPDRWGIVENSDGTGTAQQVSDSPTGFTNSFKVTTGTADTSLAATQYMRLLHTIEGNNIAHLNWGSANAKDVTLSFWVKSSLTGSFGASISNSARNRSYPFTYTVNSAGTWEYKTVTIPGDTTGTWLTDNGIGMRIYFGLGYGSTYAGTAGAWAATRYESATGGVSVIGTASATWQITGVQLEVGEQATPFEHRSYADELARCQRYFCTDLRHSIGNVGTSSSAVFVVPFPVTMRAAPTITNTATASIDLFGVGARSATTFTSSGIFVGGARWWVGGMTGSTFGMPCHLVNDCITADAEL